jgi:hypothetical protein
LLTISGCSPEPETQPPTKADVLALFQKSEPTLIKLHSMLIEDIKSERVLEIYDDHVLSGNISKVRSEEYYRLLKSIPSRHVSALKQDNNTIEVEFVIFARGFVLAGCSTVLTDFEPTKPEWAKEYIKFNINNNWYASTLCS